MITDQWKALATECSFIEDLLDTGATQIRRANYSRRGLYFQAFTNLSIGIERVGKVCLLVDSALSNKGFFSDAEKLKKNIGHDILKLYRIAKDIVLRNKIEFKFLDNLDSELHQNILKCLNQFSKGDRYYNIDLLVDQTNALSPIRIWRESVDNLIWKNYISNRRKKGIKDRAMIIDTIMGDLAVVRHIKDDDTFLNSVGSSSEETGFYEAVAPIRQLMVLQIIRYWHEIISGLNHQNLSGRKLEIPYLSDYLSAYYNGDKYLKSKKRWDNTRPG